MNHKNKAYFDEFMELPLLELKRILASGIYNRRIVFEDRFVLDALKLAIEEKEKTEQKAIVDKNLSFSRQLVIATWGLVIVTALLVLITFVKR